jgi:hypothetical protein
MEPCAGGGTGPGDVAAVLGDLRFDQDDVEHIACHLVHLRGEGTIPPKLCLYIVSQSSLKINPKNANFATFLSIHIK